MFNKAPPHEVWCYNSSNFNLSIKRSWADSVTLRLLYWRGKEPLEYPMSGTLRGSRSRCGRFAVQILPQARTKPRLHRHPARSLVTIPTKLSRLAQRNTLLLENYTGFEVLVGMTMAIISSLWSGDGAGGIFDIPVLHLPNDTISHPRTELWRIKVVVLWVLTTRIVVHDK